MLPGSSQPMPGSDASVAAMPAFMGSPSQGMSSGGGDPDIRAMLQNVSTQVGVTQRQLQQQMQTLQGIATQFPNADPKVVQAIAEATTVLQRLWTGLQLSVVKQAPDVPQAQPVAMGG